MKVKLLKEIRKTIYIVKKFIDDIPIYEVTSDSKSSVPSRVLCVDFDVAKNMLRKHRLRAAKELMPESKMRKQKPKEERLKL